MGLLEVAQLLLGVPVLAFLLYAPGAVALNLLAGRHPAPYLFSSVEEWLFSAVLVSVLVTGGLAFVLAEVGWFHWRSVLLAVALCCLLAAALAQAPLRPRALAGLLVPPPAYPQRQSDRRFARTQRVGLIALAALALVLFSRPAEMLRGALDSGVYVNAGIALGRTGEIFQRDALMRQLDQDSGEVSELMVGLNPDRYTLDRLRMPGFYVYDKKASLVVPQHYSLYPVWIGLLYSLFGIWGALYATPLLMFLAVMAVYFFARRALSPGAALLTLALLVLCPITIWFARYPVSEVITGLLAFGAFFAFMRMVQVSQEPYLDLPVAQVQSDDDGRWTMDDGVSRVPSAPHRPSSIVHRPIVSESARRPWASLWGVVAGLSLGELALARPDFIFYWAPVPIYLLYWRLARAWRPPYTWFAGTLAAMLALYLVHLSVYSFPYTLDLYHNTIINIRRLWRPLLVALYALVLLLVAADRLYPRLRPLWRRARAWAERHRPVWAGALILALASYALYHYAIGPWLPNVRFDNAGHRLPQTYVTTWASYIGAQVDLGSRYNLLRIGWYLSPLGVVVGVVGLLRWVWTRLDAATGLFFGCLLVVSFVFIQETYTDAHYIYTMRRYLPVILPALIMGFAWSCQFLWSRVRPRTGAESRRQKAEGSNRGLPRLLTAYRLLPTAYWPVALAAAIAASLALFFIYTNRVLVPHVEARGAVAQLSSLASRFPAKSVVLFSNERDEPYVVATPLQYIFGIESFALAHSYPQVNNTVLDKVVKRWQTQGYKVWVMMGANGGKLDLPGFSLKEEGPWAYDVPEFEQLYYQKPSNVSRSRLPWTIYSLEPRPQAPQPGLPFTLDIGNMDEKYLVAGFYIPERAPGDAADWRWTGDHAILRVPWPSQPGSSGALDAGKITLRLRPESPSPRHGIARTQPVTVTLTLENESTPVGRIIVPPGSPFTNYTFSVPAGIKKAGSEQGAALLHIRSSTWSARQSGLSYDARALGVQVDEVRVER